MPDGNAAAPSCIQCQEATMQHLSRTQPASDNAPDNELALRAARGDHRGDGCEHRVLQPEQRPGDEIGEPGRRRPQQQRRAVHA